MAALKEQPFFVFPPKYLCLKFHYSLFLITTFT